MLSTGFTKRVVKNDVGITLQLCNVQSAATGDKSIPQDWCTDLLTACDKYLSRVVLEEGKVLRARICLVLIIIEECNVSYL